MDMEERLLKYPFKRDQQMTELIRYRKKEKEEKKMEEFLKIKKPITKREHSRVRFNTKTQKSSSVLDANGILGLDVLVTNHKRNSNFSGTL